MTDKVGKIFEFPEGDQLLVRKDFENDERGLVETLVFTIMIGGNDLSLKKGWTTHFFGDEGAKRKRDEAFDNLDYQKASEYFNILLEQANELLE